VKKACSKCGVLVFLTKDVTSKKLLACCLSMHVVEYFSEWSENGSCEIKHVVNILVSEVNILVSEVKIAKWAYSKINILVSEAIVVAWARVICVIYTHKHEGH